MFKTTHRIGISRRRLLVTGVFALLWLCSPQVWCDPTIDLLVESNGDLLEFKPTELSSPTGATVRLTFRHTGKYVSFRHNWVLILPGTFDAVTQAALEAGEENNWVPPHDERILAATRLIGKGEQTTIEFTAPAPGDYLYICTTPGHAESMWGIFHVTAE